MDKILYEQRIQEAVQVIRHRTELVPLAALTLGSGLGDYAAALDVVAEIPYREIPGFPVSTAPGHDGRFLLGTQGGVPVICMKGRLHLYEGYAPWDVVLPVRVARELGARVLLVTNAAGGIDPSFGVGDLMLITDHISLFAPNPLIGPNLDRFGIRFPDMTHVYDEALCGLARQVAAQGGISLREGVYVQLTGPSFETPAEISMLRAMGAGAVGMSTVIEVIAARHAGLRVAGISCIANPAAGLSQAPLSGDDVNQAAALAGPRFSRLVSGFIEGLGGLELG